MDYLNDALTGGLAVVALVAVGAPYVAGLPFVKKRPNLANFVNGAGNFADRIKHDIPAGTTVAQAEAIIAAKAGPFLAEYVDSANAAKLSDDKQMQIAVTAVKKELPVGHLVADPLPATDDEVVTRVLAALEAKQKAAGTITAQAQTAAAPSPAEAALGLLSRTQPAAAT